MAIHSGEQNLTTEQLQGTKTRPSLALSRNFIQNFKVEEDTNKFSAMSQALITNGHGKDNGSSGRLEDEGRMAVEAVVQRTREG